MENQTIQNAFLIIESLAAIIGMCFSMYMVYSMFKIKKSAGNLVESVKDLSNELQNVVKPLISQMLPAPQMQNTTLDLSIDITNFNFSDILDKCNNTLQLGTELNPLTKDHILEIQDEANEFLYNNTDSEQKIYYDPEQKQFIGLPFGEFFIKVAQQVNKL